MRALAAYPGRHGNTKPIGYLILMALITLLLGGVFSETLAQSKSPFAQGGSDDLRYQAPIGARQPRPRDLPESVLRREGHTTRSQRAFDKSLQICRGC